ncbi:MAG: hypothetical protein CMH56_14415 [Myxococcales bacterium]|nr:hypothetical protein [Myxococcales bacterium]
MLVDILLRTAIEFGPLIHERNHGETQVYADAPSGPHGQVFKPCAKSPLFFNHKQSYGLKHLFLLRFNGAKGITTCL